MSDPRPAAPLSEAEQAALDAAWARDCADWDDARELFRARDRRLNATLPGRLVAWVLGRRMRDGKWPGGG